MKTEIVDCGLGFMLEVQYDNGEERGIPFTSYRNAVLAKYILDRDASFPNEGTPCDLHPVTRCKDCQHWRPSAEDSLFGGCNVVRCETYETFWCRGGVRKNGEAKN